MLDWAITFHAHARITVAGKKLALLKSGNGWEQAFPFQSGSVQVKDIYFHSIKVPGQAAELLTTFLGWAPLREPEQESIGERG